MALLPGWSPTQRPEAALVPLPPRSASLAHLAANFEHIACAPHAAAHRPPPCPASAAPSPLPLSTAHQVPNESTHNQAGQLPCAPAAAEGAAVPGHPGQLPCAIAAGGTAASACSQEVPHAAPPIHQVLYPPASPSHLFLQQEQQQQQQQEQQWQQQQHSNLVHKGCCMHTGSTSACCQAGQHASQPACLTPFEQLPASVLCDLLALNSVAASEAVIFEAVARWAAAGGFGGGEQGSQGHTLGSHRGVGGGGHPRGAGDGIHVNGSSHSCDPPALFSLSNGDCNYGSLGESTPAGAAHRQDSVQCGVEHNSHVGPGTAEPQPQHPSSSSIRHEASDVLRVLSLVRFPLMKPQVGHRCRVLLV
eukprot:1161803-Pelagomonas_calceolata.AAC.19